MVCIRQPMPADGHDAPLPESDNRKTISRSNLCAICMQHHGQLKSVPDTASYGMHHSDCHARPCPTALMLSSLRPLLEAHLPLLELGLGGIAGI